MKKLISVLLSIISVICCTFALSGCNEKEFDNSLPFKTALVSIDYSDKVNKKSKLIVSNENEKFDIEGLDYYNKANNKKLKRLTGGDRLQIYYSDDAYNNIDHILVSKSKVLTLELKSAYVLGGINEGKRLYSEKQGIVVNNTEYGAYWVTGKSGELIDLDDIDDHTKLYGTYIEEEIEITSETPYIIKLHYIHALYLYNPNK